MKESRTGQFLQAALEDKAHLRIPITPKGKPVHEAPWSRQKNAIGAYYGSEAVLKDVSRLILGLEGHGIERARQVLKTGMFNLWNNSSEETKEKFPWESFPLDKPLPVTLRTRDSLKHGGLSAGIAMLSKNSVIDYREAKEAGFSSSQITRARQTLKEWGFRVEYSYSGYDDYPQLEKRIAEELEKEFAQQDQKRLQTLLDQVTYYFHQSRPDFFVSLSRVAREAAIHFDPKKDYPVLVNVLKQAQIPTTRILYEFNSNGQKGKHHYYIIYSMHREEAANALKEGNFQEATR